MECIHLNIYLRGGNKIENQGPVYKLLLYALDKFKIKFCVAKRKSALLHPIATMHSLVPFWLSFTMNMHFNINYITKKKKLI